MINLKINEKYSITSDERQYILREHGIVEKGKAKGEERISNIGYFSSIPSALTAWARRDLRHANITEFDEVNAHIEGQNIFIRNLFTKLEVENNE